PGRGRAPVPRGRGSRPGAPDPRGEGAPPRAPEGPDEPALPEPRGEDRIAGTPPEAAQETDGKAYPEPGDPDHRGREDRPRTGGDRCRRGCGRLRRPREARGADPRDGRRTEGARGAPEGDRTVPVMEALRADEGRGEVPRADEIPARAAAAGAGRPGGRRARRPARRGPGARRAPRARLPLHLQLRPPEDVEHGF